MKERIGFVSNSSSSSFIVIGNGESEGYFVKPEVSDGCIVFGKKGETEFGCGPERITDVFSRINFAHIQAENKPEWQEMIDDIIKNEIGCDTILWELSGYIDHQSSACEGSNVEMFNSEDSLRRFLFCDDSFIQLDNDNH